MDSQILLGTLGTLIAAASFYVSYLQLRRNTDQPVTTIVSDHSDHAPQSVVMSRIDDLGRVRQHLSSALAFKKAVRVSYSVFRFAESLTGDYFRWVRANESNRLALDADSTWMPLRDTFVARRGEVCWFTLEAQASALVYNAELRLTALPAFKGVRGYLVQLRREVAPVVGVTKPKDFADRQERLLKDAAERMKTVRDVYSGAVLDYLNPGEAYRLHCIVRVGVGVFSRKLVFQSLREKDVLKIFNEHTDDSFFWKTARSGGGPKS